jgi:hypothetical protein
MRHTGRSRARSSTKLDRDRDEGLAHAVARHFQEAPARICCESIGRWFNQQLHAQGWTQQELADWLGASRTPGMTASIAFGGRGQQAPAN